MYQFKNQNSDRVEIILTDNISLREFKTMLDQLDDLVSYKEFINIIFDTRRLRDHYNFKIFLDEQNFSLNHKKHLGRVCFVSDDKSEVFLLDQFVHNFEPEFRTCDEIEEARNWIAQKNMLNN